VGPRLAAAGEATFALPSAAPAKSPAGAAGIRKKKKSKVSALENSLYDMESLYRGLLKIFACMVSAV
jgi:hypothetical protein